MCNVCLYVWYFFCVFLHLYMSVRVHTCQDIRVEAREYHVLFPVFNLLWDWLSLAVCWLAHEWCIPLFLVFMWILGIRTQVVRLAQSYFYHTEPHSRLHLEFELVWRKTLNQFLKKIIPLAFYSSPPHPQHTLNASLHKVKADKIWSWSRVAQEALSLGGKGLTGDDWEGPAPTPQGCWPWETMHTPGGGVKPMFIHTH